MKYGRYATFSIPALLEVQNMLNNEYQSTTSALLRRAELFLEDRKWSLASDYYENTLDIDPENAYAYIGLLMVSLKITKECELVQATEALNQNKYFLKAMRFADAEYRALLEKYSNDNTYFRAQLILKQANTASDFREANELLQMIAEQMDVEELLDKCKAGEEHHKRKERYEEARRLMNSSSVASLKAAILLFQNDGSEEAIRNIGICKAQIVAIEEDNRKKQRKKKIAIISIICTTVLSVILILSAIKSSNNKKAEEIYNNFLGQSFSGSIEDDDGFSRAYSNGKLNPYLTYWKTTKKRTLKFNNDGTVYYTSLYDMTVLAYPESSYAPDGYHSEYDGTYDSFSVSVSLDGTVYLKIGYQTYEVSVNSNNVPQSIYGYHEMTLR